MSTNKFFKNRLIIFFRRFALFLFVNLISLGCDDDNRSSFNKGTEEDTTELEYFQIVVLPDTQYYTSLKHGGTMEMFEQQIEWVLENYEKEHIKYVVHLGDLVDHGERQLVEWERAKSVMYRLEEPLPGFPDGIPYGIAVGNHDQEPLGNPEEEGTDEGYNRYFGSDRFEGREYYGDSYGNDNDNHFDLFAANGEKFIVMYLEYNESSNEHYEPEVQEEVFNWAAGILKEYEDHHAIVVSHSILARPEGSNSITTGGTGTNEISGEFTRQGEQIYEKLKHASNVFLMLCGHRSGEGFRRDIFNGNTIKTYLSDYQSRENSNSKRNGGNGLMRLMKFSKTHQTLGVKTFAPRSDGRNIIEADGDSFFFQPIYE